MTSFRAIIVFYHVARLQSIARASEELNVTASAVSQQVRVLEEQTGTTLVVREGRNIRLTEAGEHYFQSIADKVEGILRATEMMQGMRAPSTVVIRATPTISTKWLLPRLGRFLEEMPGTDVRLDGSNEPVDFNRDDVDLEIRHGLGGWTGLYEEPLTEERFLPVCSPSLAEAGSLEPADIPQLRLIRSIKAQVQWPTWLAALQLGEVQAGARLSFDRSHMAIEAASLGLGIALESELMMEAELRSGKLVVPVRQTPRLLARTQWMVCPRSNLRRHRVVRLMEWLREEVVLWKSDNPGDSLEYLSIF